MDLSEATGLLAYAWLLVAIPAASAAVLLFAGRRADRWGHLLGCASVGVAFVLGLTLFNRSYVEPYSSAVGQVVLLVILGCFAAGFAWMRRLAAFDMPERFLFSGSSSAATSRGGAAR